VTELIPDHKTGRPGDREKQRVADLLGSLSPILLVFLLALGLRLLVWRWHELYPLGGDEQEYFNQALTLLRERRYAELQLMRPPLYTGFLALCFVLFDSLAQNVRLVQAVISAATVIPVYGLTLQLFGRRQTALVAAPLAALSYTLAAHAAELLTETLFLFGLTTCFWLLLKATDDRRSSTEVADSSTPITHHPSPITHHPSPIAFAALAGLVVGALTLLRSVALPLLPLGMLWLLRCWILVPSALIRTGSGFWRDRRQSGLHPPTSTVVVQVCAFAVGATIVVAPWTLRNYGTYGALIVVDTTGAENLWLDNNPAGVTPADPLGREAAKRELYALGNDRAARQQLAIERGTAAILGNPAWFLAKTWGEAKKFFALEFFDDMRERRAIEVPPVQVWLRLLLGDALWLMTLIGGLTSLWLMPTHTGPGNPKWLFVPWALYVVATGLLFHVELRYRLPLYPVLLPFAAAAMLDGRLLGVQRMRSSRLRIAGWLATVLLVLGFMLLHRPYVSESVMLAGKHVRLWQADRALDAGDAPAASAAASAALARDPDSALARVALARVAILGADFAGAQRELDMALQAVPAHPRAHVLRGGVLRQIGELDQARADLSYESASVADLQTWAWDTLVLLGPPPAALRLGTGLDTGYVRGFALPLAARELPGYRWTTGTAQVRLGAAPDRAAVELRLASGRPPGAEQPSVVILADGREIGRIRLGSDRATYRLPLDQTAGVVELTIRSETFRPRDYDRSSPDGRTLGVMIERVEIVVP
jgi:hypothetical protein